NGKAKLVSNINRKIIGNPLGVYVNLENIMHQIPESEVPEKGRSLNLLAKNPLKYLRDVNQPSNGKLQEWQVVLTLKSEQDNSLVQLVNLCTAAAKYYREQEAKEAKEAKEEASVQEDTTVAPVEGPEE